MFCCLQVVFFYVEETMIKAGSCRVVWVLVLEVSMTCVGEFFFKKKNGLVFFLVFLFSFRKT